MLAITILEHRKTGQCSSHKQSEVGVWREEAGVGAGAFAVIQGKRWEWREVGGRCGVDLMPVR